MSRHRDPAHQTAPRQWELLAGGRLRLGERVVPLRDVRGFSRATVVEPNVDGHLLAIGMFFSIASCFVVPVIMAIARPKFLLGGVLFFGIGLSALLELRRSRAIVIQQLSIALGSGETLQFSLVAAAEAEALAAILANRNSALSGR